MKPQQMQRPIGFSPSEISSLINEEVVTQHAEDAAFLWMLRNSAATAPNYKLKDIVDLDERVEPNLDGLRVAGETGWEFSKQLLDQNEPGSVFSTLVLALMGEDTSKIQMIYEKIESNPELSNELIAAFGWVEKRYLQGKVHGLLVSSSFFWRRLGIAACLTHRVNPKDYLTTTLDDNDLLLKARALRAVGELGLKEYAAKLKKALRSNDEHCRYWAAWSSLLTGEFGSAIPALKRIAESDSSFNNKALLIGVRAMDTETSYVWLKEFANNPSRIRYAIEAAAAVGNSAFIPWLIKQMEVPELARVAGESFASITGVDIEYEDLDGEQPEEVDAGPNDDPDDENVSMDQDEDLPYPNPKLIQQWWDSHKQKYRTGKRYLMGEEINNKTLITVLRQGNQRQRASAATELAIIKPDMPLFETRAPAKRQQKQLESWTS